MLFLHPHTISFLSIAAALSMSSICHAALNEKALRDLLRKDSQNIIALEKELAELTSDREAAKANRDNITQLRRQIAHHKSEQTQMHSACIKLLKKVTQSGNINTVDEQKRSLLMLVAGMGNDHATELVLAEKPDLHLADKNNRLAIDYEIPSGGQAISSHLKIEWDKAVADMQTERMEELLNCGANPNWQAIGRNEDGTTSQEAPIILALRANHQDAFFLLLNYGASVETRSQEGIKIAELVVRQGNAFALSALLAKDCKTNIQFSDGRPIFEHLLAPGAEECLLAWLDKAEDNAATASNLCLVVRRGTRQDVELAFARNKNALHTEDSQGNLPLHEAARRGDVGIYNALLHLGADAQGINIRGETPLMHAALSGNADMLATILHAAPESLLKATDERGHSAIYYARLAKDPAAEQALRAAGLSPQPKD